MQKSFNLAGLSPATSYTARICADRSGSPPPQCWDADGTPHAPSEDSRTRSDVSFFTFTTLAASSSASTVSGATAVQAAAANPAYAEKTVCVTGSVGAVRLQNIDRSPKVTPKAQSGATLTGCLDLFDVKGVRVEGFRFTGCGVNTHQTNTDRIEIVGNEFASYGGYALIVWYGSSDILFERNYVRDMRLNGQWWGGYGISSRGETAASRTCGSVTTPLSGPKATHWRSAPPTGGRS